MARRKWREFFPSFSTNAAVKLNLFSFIFKCQRETENGYKKEATRGNKKEQQMLSIRYGITITKMKFLSSAAIALISNVKRFFL